MRISPGLISRRRLLLGVVLLLLGAGALQGTAWYLQYRVRARVSEALGYATLAKASISIHNEIHGALPATLHATDMPALAAQHHLAAVVWQPASLLHGTLRLHFKALGGGVQGGAQLHYHATINQHGRVRWRCDTTVGKGWLPGRYRTPACLDTAP